MIAFDIPVFMRFCGIGGLMVLHVKCTGIYSVDPTCVSVIMVITNILSIVLMYHMQTNFCSYHDKFLFVQSTLKEKNWLPS